MMTRDELEQLKLLLLLMLEVEKPGDQLRWNIQAVLDVIEVDPRMK